MSIETSLTELKINVLTKAEFETQLSLGNIDPNEFYITEDGEYAPIDSPNFIGTPTAPTATAGTNTTQIATTAFVQSSLSGAGQGDMLKTQFATNAKASSGYVDKAILADSSANADKVSGFTIGKSVPSNAVFTDTVYTHPVAHPATIITEDSSHRFVSDGEKSTWNSKQDALGYTPENTANKNVANGYAGTDSNNKIPLSLLPDISMNKTFIVNNMIDRDALTGINTADRVYVLDAGDGSREGFIWDGTQWLKDSDTDWANVSLEWANINGKPASSPADIDDSVSKKHTHTNKTIIDTITQTLIDNWNSAFSHISDAIKHITVAERTKWNTVDNKVDKISGKGLSTEDYTAIEKGKLAGIETGANKYTLPVANDSVLGGIKVGNNLSITPDGILSASSNPDNYIIKEEEFITTSNQTVFTLLAGSYIPNKNMIDVYVYGQKQPKDLFVEFNSTTITSKLPFEENVRVIIKYIQSINVTPYPVHGDMHLTGGDDAIPLANTSQDGLMSKDDKSKVHNHSNKTLLDTYTQTEISLADAVNKKHSHSGNDAGHYHGTDRDRSNHTGTQPSSTISDFASTVRNTILTGLSTTTNMVISATDSVLSALGKLQKQINDNLTTLINHIGNTSNPHGVTKSQVNLGNVDNTSDLNKPISIAVQTALDDKVANSRVLTDVPANAKFTDTIYTHPSNHPASMITESTSKRFVSDTEKAAWNSKQDALGYTPENTANKNVANGYAGTDSNNKIPLSLLPDISMNKTFIVNTIAERDALTGINTADRVYVLDAGDGSREGFIWDGTQWLKDSDTDWKNVNLEWVNVDGKPTSLPVDIDDAVNKKHSHTNKNILDTFTQTLVNSWNSAFSHVSDTIKHITNTERDKWNTIDSKVDKISGKGLSTEDYSSTEKNKLAGIESGANKYTLPPASSSILGGIKVGNNLSITQDGVLSASSNPDSYIIKEEEFITTSNQTVFNLTKGSYTPNKNMVDIYIYGQKQPKDLFIETNSTTLTSKLPFDEDVRIIAKYIQNINATPYPVHGNMHLTEGDDPIPLATIVEDGLMSRDDKVKINGNTTARHIHSNKTLLDSYTQTEINLADAVSKKHSHSGNDTSHYHSTDRDRSNHTGTQLSSTISDFTSTVRSTVLIGLSTTTNAAISVTDTVLTALGKLQKQINDNLIAVQNSLNSKVNNSQVLTDVPANAKFTDTITTINGKTGTISKSDITALGIPAQDTVVDISGKADKSYVDNKVKTDVPTGAKFTDTVYTHPPTHSASMITDLPAGKKVARFVVGTSTAGWTSKDVDYLCDGTADQTEINNAITALPATGGEIVILDGTYNITAKIDVTKNNVSIKGNGNATILKRMFNSSVEEGVITLTGRSGCKIADLQVDGNKGSYTNYRNYGIFLSSSSINTITGNTCNNNSSSGIYLKSSSNNTIAGNTCKSSYNAGIYLESSSSNTIAGNTCEGYGYNYGIYLKSSSNNNTITGNNCKGNYDAGIYLSSSSSNTITGNTCNNNDRTGISLESSSNNTVTGNTCIRGTGQASDYVNYKHTIVLESSNNNYNLISSNNCMGKAVTNEGGTGNTLVNNKWDASDDIQNIEEQINTKMPISGGALENYTEKFDLLSGTSVSLDLSTNSVFYHSLTGNTTYTITGVEISPYHANSFTLAILQGATVRTVTFPASVKWQGGEIPDLSTASKTYILTFVTFNGGATWLGMFGGEF